MKTNINKIQSFQSIIFTYDYKRAFLRISNHTLHSDLNIQTVSEVYSEIVLQIISLSTITNNSNPLIFAIDSINIPENPPRRLKIVETMKNIYI
jgi:hypothetical protein